MYVDVAENPDMSESRIKAFKKFNADNAKKTQENKAKTGTKSED